MTTQGGSTTTTPGMVATLFSLARAFTHIHASTHLLASLTYSLTMSTNTLGHSLTKAFKSSHIPCCYPISPITTTTTAFFTHPSTYSSTPSLAYSLTHSLAYSFACSLADLLICSLVHSALCPISCSNAIITYHPSIHH